jgi:hypothetical protein
MRFSLTIPSPQERLFGEWVVVKEIEIFGNLWYPQLGRIVDIGGAGRMAICEKKGCGAMGSGMSLYAELSSCGNVPLHQRAGACSRVSGGSGGYGAFAT